MSIFENIDTNPDAYIMNFLDLKTIFILSLISKKERSFLLNQKLYQDLQNLIVKESLKNIQNNISNGNGNVRSNFIFIISSRI